MIFEEIKYLTKLISFNFWTVHVGRGR